MELNLPPHPFKLKRVEGQTQIFDTFRKKWLVLTPEEWVRQHFAMYLCALGYPTGLISLERLVKINGMSKRADIVVFDPQGKPFLLVECKAPSISIAQDTIDQAARYNSQLRVPHILLTNGLQHFSLQSDANGAMTFQENIPVYPF
ncbi:MAG: type I restriction enzyme HsdR N-terminal domain-containing protein [Flavobacteriales bacterium]|nr:type I restriction enzyme HsdR N-terminal domain-containing protein [Flavobacteriales bacterium]